MYNLLLPMVGMSTPRCAMSHFLGAAETRRIEMRVWFTCGAFDVSSLHFAHMSKHQSSCYLCPPR